MWWARPPTEGVEDPSPLVKAHSAATIESRKGATERRVADGSDRRGRPGLGAHLLVLGLNLFHSDASAAIMHDGDVIFAIAEERLNRVQHFGGVPVRAIRACLQAPEPRRTPEPR